MLAHMTNWGIMTAGKRPRELQHKTIWWLVFLTSAGQIVAGFFSPSIVVSYSEAKGNYHKSAILMDTLANKPNT